VADRPFFGAWAAAQEDAESKRIANENARLDLEERKRANDSWAGAADIIAPKNAEPEQLSGPGAEGRPVVEQKPNAADAPEHRIGYALYQNPELAQDPAIDQQLTAYFTQSKNALGLKWWEAVKTAQNENFFNAVHAVRAGNLEEAKKQLNASGKFKADTLEWADEGHTRVKGVSADGKEFNINPSEAMKNLISPDAFVKNALGEREVATKETTARAHLIAATMGAGARDEWKVNPETGDYYRSLSGPVPRQRPGARPAVAAEPEQLSGPGMNGTAAAAPAPRQPIAATGTGLPPAGTVQLGGTAPAAAMGVQPDQAPAPDEEALPPTRKQETHVDTRVNHATAVINKYFGISEFTGLDQKNQPKYIAIVNRAGQLIRNGAPPEAAANTAIDEATRAEKLRGGGGNAAPYAGPAPWRK
jgi:hypothetical protein